MNRESVAYNSFDRSESVSESGTVAQITYNWVWTVYNIGRDYLGNITQIATVNGTLVAGV